MHKILTALLAVVLALPASAGIRVVSKNAGPVTIDIEGYGWSASVDHTTIRAAVIAASASDTVYVDSGTYPTSTDDVDPGDWGAAGVWIHGPSDHSAILDSDTANDYTVAAPWARTQCGISYVTFTASNSAGRNLYVNDTCGAGWTVSNCIFDGYAMVYYKNGTGTCDQSVFKNNTIRTPGYESPLLDSYIYMAGHMDRWDFIDNDIDFSGFTITSTNSYDLVLRGVELLDFKRNTITFADRTNSGTGFGILLHGESSSGGPRNSVNVFFEDNVFNASENTAGGWATMAIGYQDTNRVAATDSVNITGNRFNTPVATSHTAVQIAHDNLNAGGDEHEGITVTGNIFQGGDTGLYLGRGTRRARVYHNFFGGIDGPGVRIQGVYGANVWNNVFTQTNSGVQWRDGAVRRNYDAQIFANYFEYNTQAMDFEASTYAVPDSNGLAKANIFYKSGVVRQVSAVSGLTVWKILTFQGSSESNGIGSIDADANPGQLFNAWAIPSAMTTLGLGGF